jgi:hypothetical protein
MKLGDWWRARERARKRFEIAQAAYVVVYGARLRGMVYVNSLWVRAFAELQAARQELRELEAQQPSDER